MNSYFQNVPAGWRRMKLKYLVSLRSGEALPGEEIKETGDYPVYGGNGFRGYTSSYTHKGVRILIGRQGTYCGNINYAKEKFWATEHAIVATPKTEFDTAWLGETLRSMNLNQYSQSAAQPGISVEVIENLDIAVPPTHKQKQIANLLGQIIAPIDALVEEKQRLLNLLAEKRCVVITDFVTHGLNVEARRCDSGIPWLGEIPAHWQIERAKWLFAERDDRVGVADEELPMVSHLAGVTSRYHPVAELDPEYLDLLVRTPRFVEEIKRYSKGVRSSYRRLYTEGLYEARLPVPPLNEQRAIVKHVQIEILKLDALASSTEHTITLLQERRSVLISSVVTGQLEVGGTAA